jgi:hypothetical protein
MEHDDIEASTASVEGCFYCQPERYSHEKDQMSYSGSM